LKEATYLWRIVFGASAMLCGVVSLMSHDSELSQRLHAWGLPFASAVAYGLAIALIAGGAAMLVPRFAHIASVVLGVVFGLFTLACVPDMIATPLYPLPYVNFFEQLSIVCGAIAVYAVTETNTVRSAVIGRAARLGLGVCTASFAWAQIVYIRHTASLVPTWIPPNQMFWTNLTTVAFGLAALAILIIYRARLAMRLMALMLALFGVLVWVPRIVAHPGMFSDWTEIGANYLMAAASWLVAGVSVTLSEWKSNRTPE
jgi:uncharacterized membrane protein YphA (DoxX/SURF4 family)